MVKRLGRKLANDRAVISALSCALGEGEDRLREEVAWTIAEAAERVNDDIRVANLLHDALAPSPSAKAMIS